MLHYTKYIFTVNVKTVWLRDELIYRMNSHHVLWIVVHFGSANQ